MSVITPRFCGARLRGYLRRGHPQLGLADEFEKAATAAGATILAREFTDTTKTDFTTILTSIKGKNPELIFYGGMDAQAAPMMKQTHLHRPRRGLGGRWVSAGVHRSQGNHAAACRVAAASRLDQPDGSVYGKGLNFLFSDPTRVTLYAYK